MSSALHGNDSGSKAKEVGTFLFILFVVLPGMILILGVLGGIPLSSIGTFELIYYVLAFVVVLVGGLNWLDQHL